jgi:predicted ribosome quality control (RQC) complex YloA/Tae2 family protein
VEVDPGLSASENAQSFFALYSRAERAREAVGANIEATRDEVAYLESMLAMVEIAESESEVDEIVQELDALGFIQPRKEPGNGRKARKKRGRGAPMPAKFKAPSGHDIYVGKNNLQNDHLTMRLARAHDLWFHAKEIHGAHVLSGGGRMRNFQMRPCTPPHCSQPTTARRGCRRTWPSTIH